VPADRVSVIAPGTDRGTLQVRGRNEQVRLLAVGSVVPRKGYDLLVAALARMLDLPWSLVIAGDCSRSPDTVRKLKHEIHRLGLGQRVRLHGAATPDEVACLYESSDVFVLPTRYEGYGMAYAEAVAHGLPVIGTLAGAVPETVPEGAGILVPIDDIDALICALRRMIEHPAERERFAAKARASSFPSWREQAMRFSQVLERKVLESVA
jgi:glycosyltransferase involved in cell wall biosynthesis